MYTDYLITTLKSDDTTPFGEWFFDLKELARKIGKQHFLYWSDSCQEWLPPDYPNTPFVDDNAYMLKPDYQPVSDKPSVVQQLKDNTDTLFGHWSDELQEMAKAIGKKHFQTADSFGDWHPPCPDSQFGNSIVYRLNADYPVTKNVQETMRTFSTGATRNSDVGKLDYAKGLCPLVLKRYMEYLDKHRVQADGNLRSFDNWKQGIPEDVYMSSGLRHMMDVWLIMEGFEKESVNQNLEESLCAVIFNVFGRLHEILKRKYYAK